MATTITVGGGSSGLVPIMVNNPSTVTAALQNVLTAVFASVTTGGAGVTTNDLGTNSSTTTPGSITGSGAQSLAQFTGTVTGSGASATVPAGATDVSVTTQGNVTLAGNDSATVAVFGASSNVDYTASDSPDQHIVAGGGDDTITIQNTGNSNDTIDATGNATLNLTAAGTTQTNLTGTGTDQVNVEDSVATINASGSVTTYLTWESPTSGGRMIFTNNSTSPATVGSAVFGSGPTAQIAPNSLTVFGGVGGGYYNGGQAGNNSLVGGSGLVTLVAGGGNDFLSASANVAGQSNFLVASDGSETLVGTAGSGSNNFYTGLLYPGLGVREAQAIISATGATGVQTYDLGNGSDTIYASTVPGATNLFQVDGISSVDTITVAGVTYSGAAYATGNANYIINDFVSPSVTSVLLLSNFEGNGPGDASVIGVGAEQFHTGNTVIALSDGTTITLVGVAAADVTAKSYGSGFFNNDIVITAS